MSRRLPTYALAPPARKGGILIKMLVQNEQCSHSDYETKVPA